MSVQPSQLTNSRQQTHSIKWPSNINTYTQCWITIHAWFLFLFPFFFLLLLYLLLVLLRILSTLSGDRPQFITWKIVTSFPLSIPWTLVQRSLVWEGHLIRDSFCYLSTWERVYLLLISSLGLILFMFKVCTFVYTSKKKMNEKKKT